MAGLQGAVWALGGVPAVIRHDNLSAATHELKRSGGRQLTTRFRGVLDHYGARSSRIQPGQAHENGVVEQAHFRPPWSRPCCCAAIPTSSMPRRMKRSCGTWWSGGGIRGGGRLAEERPYLRPLPPAPVPNFTTFTCVVRRWSRSAWAGGPTRCRRACGGTPSRHGSIRRRSRSLSRPACRDDAAAAGPGRAADRLPPHHRERAFARYRYREELFPSLTFRQAYDARPHAWRARGRRVCPPPASRCDDGERQVDTGDLLQAGRAFDYASVRALVTPTIPPPDDYDACLRTVDGRCACRAASARRRGRPGNGQQAAVAVWSRCSTRSRSPTPAPDCAAPSGRPAAAWHRALERGGCAEG